MKKTLLGFLFTALSVLVMAQNPSGERLIEGWHVSGGAGAQFSLKRPKSNLLTDPLIAIPSVMGTVQLNVSWYANERWGALVTARQAYSSKPTSGAFEAVMRQTYPDKYVYVSPSEHAPGLTQVLFGAIHNRSGKKLNWQASAAIGFSNIPLTEGEGLVKTPESHGLLTISAKHNYEEKAFTAALGCQLRIPLSKLWWLSLGLETYALFSDTLAYNLKITDQVTQEIQTQKVTYYKPFGGGNAIVGIHLHL